MTPIDLYFKGLIIGFSIAAPVGPIGLLCIQRTLAYGRLTGVLSGLGAATADMFYGLVAGLGLTVLSSALLVGQFWIRLAGIIFLCYLGLRAMFSRPAEQAAQAKQSNLWGAYFSTFGLTLTNPITILSFLGILSGAGVGVDTRGVSMVIFFVLGVFSGSTLWWVILSLGVGFFRKMFKPAYLVWVNRFSGAAILVFTAAMGINLINS
jgi:threonine/homoserine/homoserine lactone efflux protein